MFASQIRNLEFSFQRKDNSSKGIEKQPNHAPQLFFTLGHRQLAKPMGFRRRQVVTGEECNQKLRPLGFSPRKPHHPSAGDRGPGWTFSPWENCQTRQKSSPEAQDRAISGGAAIRTKQDSAREEQQSQSWPGWILELLQHSTLHTHHDWKDVREGTRKIISFYSSS